ncbi:unnamed protein product [Psylliodes chrysocephalus]|uniref:Uncharacterized protein n=1 Tax=Psylliodes chrysocephalus TaxID=3402493 RepID=A0A9P0GF55_9CUCU|nr:unnamed protein product [Psylliodes chrysocephala]
MGKKESPDTVLKLITMKKCPIKTSPNKDLQLAFVIMLEDHKIILDNKMTPAIKSAKEKALKELTEIYNSNIKPNLDIKQVLKKVNNMNTKIKKITDMKKTGNKKIKLNECKKSFMTYGTEMKIQ